MKGSLRVAISVVRRQFGNSEKERLPFEAGTRRVIRDSRPRGLSACLLNRRQTVCEIAIAADCNCELVIAQQTEL
jgi:hypothetical protein